MTVSERRKTTTADLLRIWCETTLELVDRHSLRTVGPPMPGLAEQLAVALFGGRLAPSGQRDWDGEAPEGRLQVKAMWDVGKRTRRRLGVVGSDLDIFVAVVFDVQGRVAEVWKVDSDALVTLRGERQQAVVRLPWVRLNGELLPRSRVRRAAGRLGLEVHE
jgi:hypothetical protein